MVRAYYVTRLVVELICKLIGIGFIAGMFLWAAFVTAPLMALGMGIVFALAIPRALRRK